MFPLASAVTQKDSLLFIWLSAALESLARSRQSIYEEGVQVINYCAPALPTGTRNLDIDWYDCIEKPGGHLIASLEP